MAHPRFAAITRQCGQPRLQLELTSRCRQLDDEAVGNSARLERMQLPPAARLKPRRDRGVLSFNHHREVAGWADANAQSTMKRSSRTQAYRSQTRSTARLAPRSPAFPPGPSWGFVGCSLAKHPTPSQALPRSPRPPPPGRMLRARWLSKPGRYRSQSLALTAHRLPYTGGRLCFDHVGLSEWARSG